MALKEGQSNKLGLVEGVLFHEMLHSEAGDGRKGKRPVGVTAVGYAAMRRAEYTSRLRRGHRGC
jgi:hypothetical protein